MPQRIELCLVATDANVAVIQLLRRHTDKTISELRTAVQGRRPIIDESPHHNQYDAFIDRVVPLLDELDANAIAYCVRIDGQDEESTYLRNTFQRWSDITAEDEYMSDLESGEPGIETLGWLKATSPKSVFRATIERVIDDDGYNCDAATKEWAQREMDSDN